jgi:hypothetical protein
MKVEDARAKIDKVLLAHRGCAMDDAHHTSLVEEVLEAVMEHRTIQMIRQGYVDIGDPYEPTKMIDIYEAAGGEVNEDRTMVTMKPPQKPFKIWVTVVPSEITYDHVEGESVKFSVLLDDEWAVVSGRLIHNTFGETLELPVSQVHIIKEEE